MKKKIFLIASGMFSAVVLFGAGFGLWFHDVRGFILILYVMVFLYILLILDSTLD